LKETPGYIRSKILYYKDDYNKPYSAQSISTIKSQYIIYLRNIAELITVDRLCTQRTIPLAKGAMLLSILSNITSGSRLIVVVWKTPITKISCSKATYMHV